MSKHEDLVETLRRLGPETAVEGMELCPACDGLSPGLSIDEHIMHCGLCRNMHMVTLAVGDRPQFRRPDNRRNIANGEFAVLTAIGAGAAPLRFPGKQNREITLPLSALRHVDYGYTVTSFSSQGSTVDRVIVNDDSMRSSRLVNREQLYVSISPGRIDARVYTNDAEALRLAVTRDPKKEIALETVKQRPTQELKSQRNTSNVQPQQSPTHSVGMRI